MRGLPPGEEGRSGQPASHGIGGFAYHSVDEGVMKDCVDCHGRPRASTPARRPRTSCRPMTGWPARSATSRRSRAKSPPTSTGAGLAGLAAATGRPAPPRRSARRRWRHAARHLGEEQGLLHLGQQRPADAALLRRQVEPHDRRLQRQVHHDSPSTSVRRRPPTGMRTRRSIRSRR